MEIWGGFAATLMEGPGCRRIIFSTAFPSPEAKTAFLQAVNCRDVRQEFKIQQMNVGERTILIDTTDKSRNLDLVHNFLQWFLPLLRSCGAAPVHVCAHCGQTADDGCWAMVEGVVYYFHRGCAQQLQQQLKQANDQRLREDPGSYAAGAAGAVLGALLGSALWGVVLYLGYVASLVGLVIGWLANKGYDLLKGKQGKGKVVILIFAVILGVVVGTLLPNVVECFTLLEEYGLTVADIPWMLLAVWNEVPEYRSGVISNIGMGLLFAGLGVFALLRQTGQSVSGAKFRFLR